MSVRVGETGKKIYLITSFDMSSNTSLSIKATSPTNTTKTWTATLDATGFASVSLEGGGTSGAVAANRSMYYELAEQTDLDVAGVWTLVGIYENTTADPDQRYISAPVTLTVLDDNF